MNKDLFDDFTQKYEQGEIPTALQSLISNINVCYDSLKSSEHYFSFIVNYADACVFKGVPDAYETNQFLQILLAFHPHLSVLADDFLQLLKYEQMFMNAYLWTEEEWKLLKIEREDLNLFFQIIHQEGPSSQEAHFLNLIPSFYRPIMEKRLGMWQRWRAFKQAKPLLSEFLFETTKLSSLIPWHGFTYPGAATLKTCESNKIPIIFLEPFERVERVEWLKNHAGRPVVFVVDTCIHLNQILQVDFWAHWLSQPHSFLYVLEHYPNDQFRVQEELMHHRKELFQPILLSENHPLQGYVHLFSQVFKQSLNQPVEFLDRDPPSANWLYHLAKEMLFHKQLKRYGNSRLIALRMFREYQKWFDPHKGNAPLHAPLGPPQADPFMALVEENNQQRQIRRFAPKKKIRLVHVVPQVVDGGHAPSRLLRALVAYRDKAWFDASVIITERIVEHREEYPLAHFYSDPSLIRGRKTLEYWRKKGVQVFVEEHPLTYQNTVQRVIQFLKDMEADIVVFHGPDDIHNLCGSLTDVPIRVLFEHGTLPAFPCYDLAILSTEASYNRDRDKLRALGIESCPLPFGLDVKQDWEIAPYTRKQLGFPEDSFIMTTISNHLASRLGTEMCQAIGEILQRCPKAYYAPIGPLEEENQARIRAILTPYGVNERVIFLGTQKKPSQYARSMHLYLNEFPFGSALGMLDAMAAGCPVVSMHDEHGPQQAQYGGTFFGMDHIIKSGRKEDYVDLASRLATDPDFYQEWSDYARLQYEKYVDMPRYVANFEKILEHFIGYYLDQTK